MSTQFFHAIFASLIDCGNLHFRNKPQFLKLSDNLLCRSQHQVSVSQNRPHGAVFIRYFDRRFAYDAVEVNQSGRIAVYYGCADTYVGTAFTTVEELVDYIRANNQISEMDAEEGIR